VLLGGHWPRASFIIHHPSDGSLSFVANRRRGACCSLHTSSVLCPHEEARHAGYLEIDRKSQRYLSCIMLCPIKKEVSKIDPCRHCSSTLLVVRRAASPCHSSRVQASKKTIKIMRRGVEGNLSVVERERRDRVHRTVYHQDDGPLAPPGLP